MKVIVIGVLAGALSAAGLIARNVDITNHAALFLALASPALLLAIPVAGLFFLLQRHRVGAAWAGVLTGLLVAVLIPRPVAAVDGPALRVMSANLLQGRADPATVVALAAAHADVVCIQELTPSGLMQLSANGIDEDFPHRIVRPLAGGSGAGLWSRHPLHDKGSVSEPIPITAAFEVDGAPATVAVVHLSAPWPWPIEWWRSDIAAVAASLARLNGTVIAAGDFNSTRDMAQFRRILDSGYHDAGVFTPTYPADSAFPPVLAIDHILIRGGSSSQLWTADIRGSDHRAVLGTVQIPR